MANNFEPRQIAAEALERGEDPVSVVVGQLAGFASVCWDDMSGAGVFHSSTAGAAVDATVAWLHEHAETGTGSAPAEPRASAVDALHLAAEVPYGDLDERLVAVLRGLGHNFGPLGVLRAAATVWEQAMAESAAAVDAMRAAATVEDYARATAVALGVNPEAVVGQLREAQRRDNNDGQAG